MMDVSSNMRKQTRHMVAMIVRSWMPVTHWCSSSVGALSVSCCLGNWVDPFSELSNEAVVSCCCLVSTSCSRECSRVAEVTVVEAIVLGS